MAPPDLFAESYPMPLETWLTFVGASAVMLVIPGPTVLLIAGFALSRGVRGAWRCALGVALGDATALTCSLLGLGAFLQASAHLFTLLKWAGALYLIWMGVSMIRAGRSVGGRSSRPSGVSPEPPVDASAPREETAWRMMLKAYAVTALNPKAIIFFVAFVPQFITPGPDVAAQMGVILATFVSLPILNSLGFVLLAGSARSAAGDASAMRLVNRLGGSALVGAGVWTAAREAS
jgi:threonine/homoserine/homoserine lactone efflux protein